MVISAEHRSKFAALHRQWWRLQISEQFLRGTQNPKTNKQTNKQVIEMHTIAHLIFIV